MKKNLPQYEAYLESPVSAFGIELLRSVVIPELLGDETSSILYWSGKKLARAYPLHGKIDLPPFFEQAGWGNLQINDEKKDSCTIVLTSELIDARLKDNEHATFSLEAGFLAEQFEHFTKCATESFTEVKTGRKKRVEFQIKWDLKDPVGKNEEN